MLAGITRSLPALLVATKTAKQAASVGFDWEHPGQVLEKIHEELDELIEAEAEGDQADIEEEVGDLLLAVTNLSRHLKVNPEEALRKANNKFSERFNRLERSLAESGQSWEALSLAELEDRWQQIKRD